jgi:hypothetical protein
MGKLIDLTDKVFGRLTVIKQGPDEHGRHKSWVCRCACGVVKTVRGQALRDGKTVSCGCYIKEKRIKHGLRGGTNRNKKFPEYRAWASMNSRCYSTTHPQYDDYGGRGVRVCETWRNSYEEFYKHIGPRPTDKHSLDRIDNNKGYEPGNVRWATYEEQNKNRRAIGEGSLKRKERRRDACIRKMLEGMVKDG